MDVSKTNTTINSCGIHSYPWHCTKTSLVFLPADKKASWLLLPSLVSLLSGGTLQPENIYSCVLKVAGQISINTNHSYLQLSSPWVSLNWSNNERDSVLSNPIRKMWCQAGRRSKTSIPEGIFIVTPSLESWPTKAKEPPSPHELRPLTPLDTTPVFQCHVFCQLQMGQTDRQIRF